jgi:hypothetical protein
MVKNPVRAVIGAIDAAAARWSDADFAPRRRAVERVAARTGYSVPVVEYAIDRVFAPMRREAIEAVIIGELGCLDVLDRFVERPGRGRVAALPLGRICVISSRTTIGVAIVPAIFALCAKCDVVVKDREDHFVGTFFETLAEELPDLGDAAAAHAWTGDGDAPARGEFDAIVAFGSDATLAAIAAASYPARVVGFGTKASAGYVAREALRDEDAARAIARGAARDLVLYESEGCLSLHALFVEDGAVCAERFAEILAEAIDAGAAEFPPATAHAAALTRLASARDLAAFRGVRSHSTSRAEHLVVLDPPREATPLFLPRAIAVHRVERPSDAAEYLERHGITLEALAVAASRADLRELAVRIGAARIVPFGTLQQPPLGAFHGGRPRIAEFVRWIGDET